MELKSLLETLGVVFDILSVLSVLVVIPLIGYFKGISSKVATAKLEAIQAKELAARLKEDNDKELKRVNDNIIKLENNIIDLEKEVRQRNEEFTKALNTINITLAKLETTLTGINKALAKLDK